MSYSFSLYTTEWFVCYGDTMWVKITNLKDVCGPKPDRSQFKMNLYFDELSHEVSVFV